MYVYLMHINGTLKVPPARPPTTEYETDSFSGIQSGPNLASVGSSPDQSASQVGNPIWSNAQGTKLH